MTAIDPSTTPTPAEAYQTYFGPVIFEPLRDRLLPLAAPAPGEHALDVACGTGIVARSLADAVQRSGRVVAVDLNPAMLAVATRQPAPPGAAIEWREGDGADLDLPEGAFDLVCCQQGLQFFPDRAAGAAEMHRVLRPGGRAVVATWRGLDHHPLYAALAEAEEPHLASLGVDLTHDELVAPFSLGDESELRAHLAGAGFTEVTVEQTMINARFPDADRFVERMEHAYAAVVPAFNADPLAFDRYLRAIAEETRGIVASHREGDDVVVPMYTHLTVAHR